MQFLWWDVVEGANIISPTKLVISFTVAQSLKKRKHLIKFKRLAIHRESGPML